MAPARRLSLAHQALGLRSVFPDSESMIKHGQLTWTGRLQPCELSRVYTVEITYRQGRYPVTRVLAPLLKETGTGFLPHIFNDRSLCLHDVGQWTENMLIVDTIVPWAAEWLMHYEVWLATEEWFGDLQLEAPVSRPYESLPAL
jgi:hypothetical protein